MNGISRFMAILARHDISLAADGDELVIRFPKGMVDDDVVAVVREHKPDFLAYLRGDHRGGNSGANVPTSATE